MGPESNQSYGYGFWPLVVVNTAVLIIFAASFVRPRTSRDWRALGAFGGFALALFTEMYGFPLTIYLLAGPLGNRFPNLGFSHAQGHLWNDLIGWRGDPHLSPFHLASFAAMIGGFALLAAGWRRLYHAQRAGTLATGGVYDAVRHPQYAGFLLTMIAFLLMWPTIPTLVMFPVLVYVYRRLATAEEREVAARFGAAWSDYADRTPRFLPRLGATAARRGRATSPPTPETDAELAPTKRELGVGPAPGRPIKAGPAIRRADDRAHRGRGRVRRAR